MNNHVRIIVETSKKYIKRRQYQNKKVFNTHHKYPSLSLIHNHAYKLDLDFDLQTLFLFYQSIHLLYEQILRRYGQVLQIHTDDPTHVRLECLLY